MTTLSKKKKNFFEPWLQFQENAMKNQGSYKVLYNTCGIQLRVAFKR